jgi:hypothetical protein
VFTFSPTTTASRAARVGTASDGVPTPRRSGFLPAVGWSWQWVGVLAQSSAVPGVVCALGLLWPLLWLALRGVSPASLTEESTGYRYFASLQPLLGERPVWTPQGHAPALVHSGIQLLLNVAGFPIEQLHPRIDVWAILAAAVPSLAAGIALVWAARPLGAGLATWLIGLFVVAAAYEQRAGAGLVLTFPDYCGWSMVFALVTLGWCLRIRESGAGTFTWTWHVLALFGGLALAVKPTYLVYPLTVGVMLLSASGGTCERFLGPA